METHVIYRVGSWYGLSASGNWIFAFRNGHECKGQRPSFRDFFEGRLSPIIKEPYSVASRILEAVLQLPDMSALQVQVTPLVALALLLEGAAEVGGYVKISRGQTSFRVHVPLNCPEKAGTNYGVVIINHGEKVAGFNVDTMGE